jgi:hypothetical protein
MRRSPSAACSGVQAPARDAEPAPAPAAGEPPRGSAPSDRAGHVASWRRRSALCCWRTARRGRGSRGGRAAISAAVRPLQPHGQVRELLREATLAPRRHCPPLRVGGELAGGLPHPPAVLHTRGRPTNKNAVRDRGHPRWRLHSPQTTEPCGLDPRARQPHHRSLTPDPRLPTQPARRLELRHMPAHDTLIQIEPHLNRRHRHHPQPADEPPHPHPHWTPGLDWQLTTRTPSICACTWGAGSQLPQRAPAV